MLHYDDLHILKESFNRSKDILATLHNTGNDTDTLETNIKNYIKCRYMLTEMPKSSDRIYDLAEESAAIMARLPAASLRAAEDISGCTGAKSAMIKKVLLLMSLNQALGWNLSEDACQALETVADIIRYSINDVNMRADQTRIK